MNEKNVRLKNSMKSLAMLLLLGVAVLNMSFAMMPARAQTMTTFEVPNFTGRVGDIIFVPVYVYDAEGLWGWQVMMDWDPAVLNVLDVVFAGFLMDQPENSTNLLDLRSDFLLATETTFQDYPGKTAGFATLMWVKCEILILTTSLIDIDGPIHGPFTFWMDRSLVVYGDDPGEMIKESGYYSAPWPEDITADGIVDALDLAYVAINWQNEYPDIQPPYADVNGDNVVDIVDLAMVALKYGQYAG